MVFISRFTTFVSDFLGLFFIEVGIYNFRKYTDYRLYR